jgi:predicted  nucleic acid-binding Zn-ribbon protein
LNTNSTTKLSEQLRAELDALTARRAELDPELLAAQFDIKQARASFLKNSAPRQAMTDAATGCKALEEAIADLDGQIEELRARVQRAADAEARADKLLLASEVAAAGNVTLKALQDSEAAALKGIEDLARHVLLSRDAHRASRQDFGRLLQQIGGDARAVCCELESAGADLSGITAHTVGSFDLPVDRPFHVAPELKDSPFWTELSSALSMLNNKKAGA